MSVNGIQGPNAAGQLYSAQAPQQQQVSPDQQIKQSESLIATVKSMEPVADQVNISSPITRKNLDTVKAIEQLHNQMNTLIKGVRETNESLNNAAEQMSRMASTLEGITKNFPPFPQDSKDRQALLMSYTSIRQEIMKMTVPPPPPPIYEKIKSTWDSVFSPFGQILPTVVPALGSNSTDQQVQTALSQTQTTGDNLASLSSETTQALVQA